MEKTLRGWQEIFTLQALSKAKESGARTEDSGRDGEFIGLLFHMLICCIFSLLYSLFYFFANQPECNIFSNLSKEDQKKIRQVRVYPRL